MTNIRNINIFHFNGQAPSCLLRYWLGIFNQNTVELQWLEHLWDHEN